VSEDIEMWNEFFKALDEVNAKPIRRLFIRDEILHKTLAFREIKVYNLFLNCQAPALYHSLKAGLTSQAGVLRSEGFPDSYDRGRLVRVRFEEASIVQFISIEEPIDKEMYGLVVLLTQHYLRRSPLVIFC